MRWIIRRMKYPADPDRPWIAHPKGSIMAGRRFPTWSAALEWVNQRRQRKPR